MAIYITNPQTQIKNPGQYEISDVYLTSPLNLELSIFNLITHINIHESVFQNTMSGNVMVRDTANLISTYPICGYETLNVIFNCSDSRETDSFSLSFRVYSISNILELSGSGKTYTLELISGEFLTDIETSISRAFNSKSASEIVDKVWVDSLLSEKSLRVEETRGLLDVISPYWSPFKLIKWLCSRSVSKDREGANYLFFETLDGFSFVSLETLVAEATGDMETYYYGAMGIGGNVNAAYTTEDVQVDSSFNLIENLSLGMYSNTMIEHDIVKKTIKTHNFDYEKSFDSYEHLDDWSLLHKDVSDFKEVYDSKKFFIPQHYQLFGEFEIGSRETSSREKALQVRASQLQQINIYKITMVLPGNIRTRAGDVIYLVYPPKGASGSEDPLMSGRYLVLSVKNTMSTARHLTTMEIVKDSYFGEIPSQGV